MNSGRFVIKIIFFILPAAGIFFAGYIAGYSEIDQGRIKESMAARSMARYLYKEIDENFGTINEKNRAGHTVIGYIPLYKDIGFGIILENGTKTIRVYAPE